MATSTPTTLPTTLMETPAVTAGALTTDDLSAFQDDFQSKPAYRLMQNAVTETTIDAVALNRQVVTRADHTLFHPISTTGR